MSGDKQLAADLRLVASEINSDTSEVVSWIAFGARGLGRYDEQRNKEDFAACMAGSRNEQQALTRNAPVDGKLHFLLKLYRLWHVLCIAMWQAYMQIILYASVFISLCSAAFCGHVLSFRGQPRP